MAVSLSDGSAFSQQARRELADCHPHLRALWITPGYNADMPGTSTAKVSHRGQTNLPSELRHRWGIEQGGEVGIIDLGDAALVVPGGIRAARHELHRVLRDRYETGLASIEDHDLADQ
jgi:bifunctional DNA-binding transcriptional regulator/antitoxin component of YhaV-PrlF toxin-antitoxin module